MTTAIDIRDVTKIYNPGSNQAVKALDLKLRQAMREELKQLQKETGITFVFVTHDQEEALAMSDLLANGTAVMTNHWSGFSRLGRLTGAPKAQSLIDKVWTKVMP